MANTFGFLKIGEANKEIAKLTTERDELKTRLEAAESNANEIATQAESDRKALTEGGDWKEKYNAEVSAHASTKSQLEKAASDLKTAQAEVAALPEKIKVAGSQEAQNIMASLGQSPIPSTPSATPGAPAKTELTGIEKTRASFRAQVEKLTTK